MISAVERILNSKCTLYALQCAPSLPSKLEMLQRGEARLESCVLYMRVDSDGGVKSWIGGMDGMDARWMGGGMDGHGISVHGAWRKALAWAWEWAWALGVRSDFARLSSRFPSSFQMMAHSPPLLSCIPPPTPFRTGIRPPSRHRGLTALASGPLSRRPSVGVTVSSAFAFCIVIYDMSSTSGAESAGRGEWTGFGCLGDLGHGRGRDENGSPMVLKRCESGFGLV
jgi:hypothetical protein